MPALPLIGGGGMKFQPVYVGDVAEAILRCVENPNTAGKTYELGGPGIFSFAELMRRLLREIGRRRLLLAVAVWNCPYFRLLSWSCCRCRRSLAIR